MVNCVWLSFAIVKIGQHVFFVHVSNGLVDSVTCNVAAAKVASLIPLLLDGFQKMSRLLWLSDVYVNSVGVVS